ncbi:hypothetical protein [Cryptosporangium phraense]|uniref:Tyrosine-type recombinase/integrase n=1 Tax=Cryptosporangium phraense TaxID=2593070 RepID=A0A545AVG7_9ACTN|nr:hypothetical protein [Cryptosporangium phraense]TQS45332.1 hypothetical protein FL583_09575 [Cryptosporangium phraense]
MSPSLHDIRRVEPYSARKSVLSFLANKVGVKDTILQAWARHSDGSVTERFYIHTTVDDLTVASDASQQREQERHSPANRKVPLTC